MPYPPLSDAVTASESQADEVAGDPDDLSLSASATLDQAEMESFKSPATQQSALSKVEELVLGKPE